MRLTIDNKELNIDILDVLNRIKKEKNILLSSIQDKGDYYRVTCPFHKGGQEKNPSCSVYKAIDTDIMQGTWHCFTCGRSGSLLSFISGCLNISIDNSKKWLLGSSYIIENTNIYLSEPIKDNKIIIKYLDESILEKYNYHHPYMDYRKLNENVLSIFQVGCTEDGEYITFPCWDEHDKLVGITKRSTKDKKFILPKDWEKPIYLFNFLKRWNIDTAILVESQINCLTCWGWGFPSIALLGTGTEHQYDILNKSHIRHLILCYDGDYAGQCGSKKIVSNIRKDVIINNVIMPGGKDINDLTEKEFIYLLEKNNINIENLKNKIKNIKI